MAYLKSGNKDAGSGALKKVAKNGDDPVLTRQAEVMLKKMKDDKRKRFSLSLSYSIEADDNVLLQPSEAISGSIKTGEDDIIHKLSFRAGYKFSFDNSTLNTSYSYFQSIHNNLSEFDLKGLATSFAYVTPLGGGESTLPLSISYYFLDDDPYLWIMTVAPTYAYNLNNDNWMIVNFAVSSKDFLDNSLPIDENRDALNFSGGFSYLTFFKERKGNLSLGYALDFEETTEKGNWSYIGNKVVLALLYPVADEIDFQLFGQFYNQAYRREHDFYGKKRMDDIYEIKPKITYHFDKVDVSIRYSYTRSKSNISDFDYTRNVITSTVGYTY